MSDSLERQPILAALRAALEPLEYVYAMWEGGAAAFGRIDRWSDIDLMVDAQDERVGEVMALIETTLAGLSPLDLKYPLPEPTWHGHAQTFFRLVNAGPYLLLDVCVLRHSNPNRFIEREIHGEAVVHFDKAGVVQPAPLDQQALALRLAERLETLQVTFDLFQSLTLKELQRGNRIEALAFYNGYTLRPLLETLRIRFQPARYNFHTRYVYYDLPGEIVARLEALFFVKDAPDLERKRQAAEAWFYEALAQARTALKI
jgi:hypothetical protein